MVQHPHSLMGHQNNPSWCTPCAIALSSQCYTTSVTTDVVCAVLSDTVHKKDPLLLIRKSCIWSSSGGFPFLLTWIVLYHVLCYKTINKMCQVHHYNMSFISFALKAKDNSVVQVPHWCTFSPRSIPVGETNGIFLKTILISIYPLKRFQVNS